MTNKLKPALLGGFVLGILAVISSVIPLAGFCCCLWGILAGLLAGLLYIKRSPLPVRIGDGAVVGALTGLIGAVIYLIIGIPITYFFVGTAQINEQLARSGVNLPVSGLVLVIVAALIGAICLVILAVLGGILAVPIFERRKGNVPPPPPAM
ncbi:MAG: hypothetical protein ABR555_14110 [Pyrinomonadaceae bacterium]